MKISDLSKVAELSMERDTLIASFDRAPHQRWELVANRQGDEDDGSFEIPPDMALDMIRGRINSIETQLGSLGVTIDPIVHPIVYLPSGPNPRIQS